jgi:hypothetical protein
MPVTTRSQYRKRKAEAPAGKLVSASEFEDFATNFFNNEATQLEINSQPALEYHPSYKFHDLANDQELQRSLYGQDFYYDLSNWPHRCWFEPKTYAYDPPKPINNFETLFSKLRLMQLFSHAYRHFNPHKMVNVKVDCLLDQGYGSYQIQCVNMPLGDSIMAIWQLEQELVKRCKEAVHIINLQEELDAVKKNALEHYTPTCLNCVFRVTFEQA